MLWPGEHVTGLNHQCQYWVCGDGVAGADIHHPPVWQMGRGEGSTSFTHHTSHSTPLPVLTPTFAIQLSDIAENTLPCLMTTSKLGITYCCERQRQRTYHNVWGKSAPGVPVKQTASNGQGIKDCGVMATQRPSERLMETVLTGCTTKYLTKIWLDRLIFSLPQIVNSTTVCCL